MVETRRTFLTSSAGVLGTVAMPGPSGSAEPLPGNRLSSSSRMKLGTQEPSSEANFRRFQRFGVTHICGWYRIGERGRLYPTVDELNSVVDRANQYNLKVEMTDTELGRGAHSALMSAGAQRDREIEAFQNTIRNCSRAGIPTLKYYLSVLPILRLGEAPGRGDTRYMRWNYDLASSPVGEQTMAPPDRADLAYIRTNYANFDADMFWERINYVLERIVPVANEFKVRLAQHPHDPGLPPAGIAGVPNVLGTVEGLKRFVSIRESPYHGLNFCQGTISESLPNPREQILDVIRWFGSRNKIFNVHFRNIRGHLNDFVAEAFPDDGDIDLLACARAYHSVGYDGTLMPDHVPHPAPDTPDRVAATDEMFTFGYGYIRGLLQAVSS